MLINKNVIITFIISLIITYPIIGYLKSNIGVVICWKENVTLMQKLDEYYIRTFLDNIIISSIISAIITFLVGTLSKKKLKNQDLV